MREIKFRYWNGKTMSPNVGVHPFLATRHVKDDEKPVNDGYFYDNNEEGCITVWSHNRDNLMQYTGLKDKNGKEIYEGDIIKLLDNTTGYLKVEFKNQYVGGWVLTYKDKDTSLGARKAKELEIIGNIHENPDLLKK